jgi:hypothetical protein
MSSNTFTVYLEGPERMVLEPGIEYPAILSVEIFEPLLSAVQIVKLDGFDVKLTLPLTDFYEKRIVGKFEIPFTMKLPSPKNPGSVGSVKRITYDPPPDQLTSYQESLNSVYLLGCLPLGVVKIEISRIGNSGNSPNKLTFQVQVDIGSVKISKIIIELMNREKQVTHRENFTDIRSFIYGRSVTIYMSPSDLVKIKFARVRVDVPFAFDPECCIEI